MNDEYGSMLMQMINSRIPEVVSAVWNAYQARDAE